ncbi:MAG TPA: diaminopimelate epimerase [Clostridiales bacterium]|jgi:diaminopimelate epimerase|nr:diaminopimelate epimerase [Clostridiales bacterium]
MLRDFVKMHGAGNDYIYFDCFESPLENPSELAVKLSSRRFSIGADGIILVHPSQVADARMQMFNADGSEGKMCGNGIRCVAKYLYDYKKIGKSLLTVETLAGIKTIRLAIEHDVAVRATVDMGIASFEADTIPMHVEGTCIERSITVLGQVWHCTAVSMGNPHAVIFTDEVDHMPVERFGPSFEHHILFPEGVNTEFAKIISPTHIKMRVWERGSGETLACGTGASATVAAAVKLGKCPANTPVKVDLLGGSLTIIVSKDYHVSMEGPAEVAFEGKVRV